MAAGTRAALWLPFLCLLACVHATIYPSRFSGVTWDDDNWRLTTTSLDQGHYQSRASLSNGYVGINLAALGPFFEVDTQVNGDNINGWPLFDRRQTFSTISGFWDVQPKTNMTNYAWLDVLGGESVISGIPHFGGIHLKVGSNVLDASTDAAQISGFSSTLDMGAGMMSWQYTWTPPGSPALDIEYNTFVHKLYVNQAFTQLRVTSSRDVNVTAIDVLNGDCALRTKFMDKKLEDNWSIWTAVQPNGIPSVTGYVYSTMLGDSSADKSSRKQVTNKPWAGTNVSSIAQSVTLNLLAGKPAKVEKFIGVASTDAFDDPQSVAMAASSAALKAGFVKSLGTHITEWQSIMPADSIDNYAFPANGSLPNDQDIIELQISSVVNPYNLLQQTIGTNAITMANNNTKLGVNSIAVGGLGSESYAGFIFWDAEVWMAPGLVVAHPDAASQIANYRVAKYPMAKKNIGEAYTSSQNKTQFSSDAAIFPWTSGRFGNCTGTGPCFDYEYHINGDIGLELLNYYIVSGDAETFKNEYFPVYQSIAQVYVDLLHFNKTSGKYVLTNATDPDEYANFVNNPGYTMVLMQTHINQTIKFQQQFGLPVNQSWTHISENINIPFDPAANLILEYSTMNGSIEVKQADVVLVDDLLDYKNPYTLSDLDFYAGRQSLNGPGMTYGVFSIVAAKAAPSGCSAYTYQLYSGLPYTRAPFYQYSEQLDDDFTTNGGTHPAYPFLTAMGGSNRVAIFAYLGLRLKPDVLNVDPTLPPQIPHLRYRTFYWQGHALQAVANQTHTTITRMSSSLSTANPTYATAAIPVTVGSSTTTTHNLAPNGTLTLPNRAQGLVKTVPGNLAQCLPATSPQESEPGQFPLSAVDGAVSTKWQPSSRSTPASLTIDLGAGAAAAKVAGFALDWAQSPPRTFSIAFSNSSSGAKSHVVVDAQKVKISNPYDAKTAAQIVPYASNTTNVTLPSPVYGGRYATLTINGSLADANATGPGASVAEWAIVAAGHKALMRRYYEGL